jgi:arylsulfatase A-like enzyme
MVFALICGLILGNAVGLLELISNVDPSLFFRSFQNTLIVILTVIVLYSAGGLLTGCLAGGLLVVCYSLVHRNDGKITSVYSHTFTFLIALFFFLTLSSWIHRIYCVNEPWTSAKGLILTLIILVFSFGLYYFVLNVTRHFISEKNSLGKNTGIVSTLIFVIICVFGLYLLTGARSKSSGTAKSVPESRLLDLPNIILITIDTLRADHLHCYGYQRIQTTEIDRIAEEGVLFENAISHIGSTGPSHSSILTSQYPRSHMVLRNGYPLSTELVLLPEILKDHGYLTAAFVSSAALAKRMGFDQGFDFFVETYDDGLLTLVDQTRKLMLSELVFSTSIYQIFERILPKLPAQTDAASVNSFLLPWLREHRNNSFFLWLHYYDPHEPFTPPPPYDTMYWEKNREVTKLQYSTQFMDIFRNQHNLTPDEIERVISLYDGEVTFVDCAIGEVMRELEALGIRDNSFLIVTADHGEQLYEHHRAIGHFLFLYEPIVHVPLIFSYPGVLPAGMRMESLVQSIDIAPTILEAIHVPVHKNFEGVSLYGMMKSRWDQGNRRFTFSEVFSLDTEYDTKVIRSNKWKLFDYHNEKKNPELFRIDIDRKECNNVYEDNETYRMLNSELEMWNRRFPQVNAVTFPPPVIDKEIQQRLNSLGYIN